MDIFSLGCVIGELFLEGKYLFVLAQLQNYRKGTYDPSILLQQIKSNYFSDLFPLDENIVNLIKDMIQLEPEKRKSISEYLQKWCDLVFPEIFSSFLYQFNSSLLDPQLADADDRIAFIHKHIDIIWKGCFNKDIPSFSEPLNHTLFEKLREDPFNKITRNLIPRNFKLIYSFEEGSNSVILNEENLQPSVQKE